MPENFWPCKAFRYSILKKKTKPQSLFDSNAHMLAAVRTLLGASCSPPRRSSGTPALLAHMHRLEALAHCSVSLMSLIRFRPSCPRGICHDGLSQQSLYASEIIKILRNSGLALWQYSRLLRWRLGLREGHENQGWAVGADRSFWATKNFCMVSKSVILPMGIQQSLQPGKLAYNWWACPAATLRSWDNPCINGRGAQSHHSGPKKVGEQHPEEHVQQGTWAAHPCPALQETCHWHQWECFKLLNIKGNFALSEMPVAQRDADVSTPCLMHLSLVRWWKGTPSTVIQPPSSLGNVLNAPQRAQTAGQSSSLLLQLLAQKRAVEPKVRGTSRVRQGHRREPGPRCSTLLQFTVCFGGRFCLHRPSLTDGKQRAKHPPARRSVLAASPIQGQPCARESPPQHCCTWKMSYSNTDIAVCSHTQLQSELFNCIDIIEVQTLMPVFFPKWKKEHYIMPILRNTPSLRTTAESLSQKAWLKCKGSGR